MSALPMLIITREGETIRSQSLDAEISIGRGEGNIVRLEDRAVSRKHAVIRKTSEGVQIEKQSDFAPIRLNGIECTRALIREGDVVDIGPFRVRIDPPKKEIVREVPRETPREVPKEASRELTPEAVQPTELPPMPMVPEALSVEETLVLDESEMQKADPLPTDLSVGSLDLGGGGPLMIDESEATQGMGIAQPILGDTSSAELGSQDPGTAIFSDNSATNAVAPEGADGEVPALSIDFGNLSGNAEATPAPVEMTIDENAATRVLKTAIDACLEIPSGLANLEKLDLTKSEIFIGRGKECDLVLNDKKSSRKNTVISRVGNRYVLKDLDSSNGTYVNGKSVREAELSADDVIRIGEVEIKFKALNPDYEKKKSKFMSVAEAEALAPPVSELPQEIRGTPLNPMSNGYGAPGMQPEAAPSKPVKKGIFGIIDKYFKNFGSLKPIQKALVVLSVGLFMSWYFEDELGLNEKPKARPAAVKKSADGKPVVATDFDGLTPEKQKVITEAMRRANDAMPLMDFDKALYEVTSFVFPILPDYAPAKEIQRYAQEGKRRKDAIAEEAKKKEEARKLKEHIVDLENQTKAFMAKRKYDEAKETFGEILSIDPDNASVSEWKREIDAWVEEQTRIAQEKQVQEEINKRAWDTYNEAFELHKAGKFREAIEIYKKVPELGTDDQILLKKYATMVKTCQDSIRDLRDPHLKKAKELEAMPDLAGAFKEYQIATEVDPPHPEGWAGMDRIRDVLTERAKILYTEAVIAESYSDFKTAHSKFLEILKMAPDGSLYHQRATRKLQSYLNFKPDEETQ